MPDDASRLAVLERLLDGFNRHDVDAIMAEFAEDCVFQSPRGPEPWGRRLVGQDAVRAGVRGALRGDPRRALRRAKATSSPVIAPSPSGR